MEVLRDRNFINEYYDILNENKDIIDSFNLPSYYWF